ncbi:unnamed protein product, partial [Didymodactylos carnosus]
MKNQLTFPYNIDKIVDDWILMGFLVGNDFVPHLPHLHINENALLLLWDTYKKILPKLDGYLNESGQINLPRFEIYMAELAKFDFERFAHENDTLKYFDKLHSIPPEECVNENQTDNNNDVHNMDNSNDNDNSVYFDPDKDHSSAYETISAQNGNEEERPVIQSSTILDDNDNEPLIESEFRQHKTHYYREKMNIEQMTSNIMTTNVENYIFALQWILKYYYNGCQSWSWFYPQHYAPYLSDLKNFKDLNIQFDNGKPFRPFEQLLAVLPPTSCDLLPKPLQSLMTDIESPLLQFYPEDFCLDQNEK